MTDISADKQLKVTMFLCDYAQVSSEGKVTAVGAFWTFVGPGPAAFFIAGSVEVPWTSSNRQHQFRFECVDLDGNAVMIPTDEGESPLFAEGAFEVGRPPGIRPGSSLAVPFAIPVGPVQIPPGGHYEWRLTIDGETREEWRLSFATRSPFPRAAS